MPICVYALMSDQDGKRYVGIAKNIVDRLKRHNSARVPSTKSRGPFRIVYQEQCSSYREARLREKFLKSGQGRLFLDKTL